MPLSTLAKTLEVTTQLTKNTLRLPMRRHIKSRFPQLNRNRLREIYATDTIFSSVPAINTGNTCMQVFSAKKSKFCAEYGMKTESCGAETLETFIAEIGAPYYMVIEFLNGGLELMTYNDLINHYNQVNEINAELYSFKKITGHRRDGNK